MTTVFVLTGHQFLSAESKWMWHFTITSGLCSHSPSVVSHSQTYDLDHSRFYNLLSWNTFQRLWYQSIKTSNDSDKFPNPSNTSRTTRQLNSVLECGNFSHIDNSSLLACFSVRILWHRSYPKHVCIVDIHNHLHMLYIYTHKMSTEAMLSRTDHVAGGAAVQTEASDRERGSWQECLQGLEGADEQGQWKATCALRPERGSTQKVSQQT